MFRPRTASPAAAAMLSALIPCLFVGCWYYWTRGGTGIMPARAIEGLLGLTALSACVAAVAGRGLPGWSWRSPLPWALAAVVWQTVALTWSPLTDPGGIIVAERWATLAMAVAVAAWMPSWWALGLWALAIMGGDVLSQHIPAVMNTCGPATPFGNQNFNASAAMVAVVAACLAWPALRTRRHARAGTWIAAGLGLLALGCAVMMGLPEPIGRGTRAIWLGMAAGLSTWVVLSLPLPRLVAPALLAAGFATALAIQGACIAGLLPVTAGGPSWEQRVWFWRGSLRLISESPLIGIGPGGTIDALQRVPETCGHWLAVPSFAEHAHSEWLQVWLDGGAINAALVATGVALTLLPLWRRRRSPAAKALLAGWAALLAHALAESHLSQPGALWSAALLAGASWGWVRTTSAAQAPSFPLQLTTAGMGLAAGLLMAWMAVRDFGPGGTPPMLWRRHFTMAEAYENAAQRAEQENRPTEAAYFWRGAAGALAELRLRNGPLDDLLWREARYRLLASRFLDPAGAAAERAEAERLVAEQLRRLPVAAGGLTMAKVIIQERKANGRPAGELEPLLAEAERIARSWLERTRNNAKNASHREALAKILEKTPEAPAGQ